jgi:hypothetical protein
MAAPPPFPDYLTNFNQLSTRLQQAIGTGRGHITALNTRNREFREGIIQRITAINDTIAQIQPRLTALNAELLRLRTQVGENTGRLQQNDATIAQLNARIQELERDLAAVNGSSQLDPANIRNRNDSVVGLNNRIRELEGRIQQLETRNANLERWNAEAERQIGIITPFINEAIVLLNSLNGIGELSAAQITDILQGLTTINTSLQTIFNGLPPPPPDGRGGPGPDPGRGGPGRGAPGRGDGGRASGLLGRFFGSRASQAQQPSGTIVQQDGPEQARVVREEINPGENISQEDRAELERIAGEPPRERERERERTRERQGSSSDDEYGGLYFGGRRKSRRRRYKKNKIQKGGFVYNPNNKHTFRSKNHSSRTRSRKTTTTSSHTTKSSRRRAKRTRM